MRYFIFILKTTFIFLIFSLVSCGNEVCRYDYELYGLNTAVKSVKVLTYDADNKFGEVVKGDLKFLGNYVAVFNAVGNIQSVSDFDDDGDLLWVSKYKYNEKNHMIEHLSYNSDGEVEYKNTFEYVYDGDKIISVTQISRYDDIDTYYLYESIYDDNTIVEENTFINSDFVSKTKYLKYDDSGKEWILYDKDGVEESRGYEYYNKSGRVVSSCNGEKSFEVKWNDKNLPIYIKNAQLYNNTIISSLVDMEGCIYYMEYEYDKMGNWIKQIVYEGELKIPVSISEREITY